MNLFYRSSSSASTSTRNQPINPNINNLGYINSEEYNIMDIDRKLLEWYKCRGKICKCPFRANYTTFCPL